jgi:hypothetical protein
MLFVGAFVLAPKRCPALLFALVLLFLIGEPSAAKNILGLVVDKQSGKPIENANICLVGSSNGTTSDSAGFFAIPNVPESEYRVTASFIGYKTQTVDGLANDTFKDNVIILKMEPTLVKLPQVTIEENRLVESNLNSTGGFMAKKVKTTQVRNAIGAMDDVIRYYSVFPAIQQKTDLNSLLYIRGGSPDQNLVLIDDVPIFNPYAMRISLGGAISLIDNELLNSAEMLDSGFGARYGNRLSSIINIDYKEGSREKFQGESNLNVTTGNVSMQGPFAKGKGSFIAGLGASYFDFLVEQTRVKDVSVLIPQRQQFHGKVVYHFNENNKLSLLFINGKDETGVKDYKPENITLDNESYTRVASVRHEVILNPHTFVSTTLSYYHDRNYLQFFDNGNIFHGGKLAFHTASRNIRGEITWNPMKITRFVVGSELNTSTEYLAWAVNWRSNVDLPIDIHFRGKERLYAFYAENSTNVKRNTTITIGLRKSITRNFKPSILSPRLRIENRLSDKILLSASWGVYHQYPSMFSTVLRGVPIDISKNYASLQPEQAKYTDISTQFSPAQNISVTLSGYHRSLSDLLIADEQTIYVADNIGSGFANGLELQLRCVSGLWDRLSFYLAYAYANAKYKTPKSQWTYFDHDRRHSLSCSFNVNISTSLSVDTQWRFGSGFPYTPIVGHLNSPDSWQADPYGWVLVKGQKNSQRLPPYQRLDLRVSYKSHIGKIKTSFYLELVNILNIHNIFYYDWSWNNNRPADDAIEKTPIYMMPFMPMAGSRFEF